MVYAMRLKRRICGDEAYAGSKMKQVLQLRTQAKYNLNKMYSLVCGKLTLVRNVHIIEPNNCFRVHEDAGVKSDFNLT